MPNNPISISDRAAQIEASGIRKFFDLAQNMKDPIDLSIGQPHFGPSAAVRDAAIDAIRAGHNRYTVTQGIEPLRKKLRDSLSRQFPVTEDDDFLITGGVAGGVLLSFLCALNPGDEIMFADPYFVMYKHLARICGAVPVPVLTFPDFALTRERLERAVTPKTRAIAVNSPSNPTGHMMDEAECRMVADFARERGLLLISDEIYAAFAYDMPHISPKRFNPQTLVLGGFSKSFGIPGWRMGYAVGPRLLLDKMRVLQQFTFVCAPTPFQYGVLAGMEEDFAPRLAEYRAKRDKIYEGLRTHYRVDRPQGAFYIFPELPHGVEEGAFIERCIERNLLVVPGTACSSRTTHFRISYAADDRSLDRGIAVLREVAESFRK